MSLPAAARPPELRASPCPVCPLARRLAALALCGVFALALGGCAVVTVAGAAAGAAISVTGAVVSTGVEVTGKVVGKAVDLVADED